jgi:hypothetical protein
MPTKAVKKTRIQWAAVIRAAHTTTVEAILKLGRALTDAKGELEHGEFLAMIKTDLPFDASTAQRLMKIASDPRLQKPHTAQLLPASWGTLYELTKLPDAQFEQAVATGAIRPSMTRADVSTLRPSYSYNCRGC